MGEGFQIHDTQLHLIKESSYSKKLVCVYHHNLTLKNRLIEPLIEALAWLATIFVFIKHQTISAKIDVTEEIVLRSEIE